MKKTLIYTLTIILSLAVSACGKVSETITGETTNTESSSTEVSESVNTPVADTITIFSINDVHGSLTESPYHEELGLAKLDYAIRHDEDYDETTSILISCGDAWQGGYLAHEDKSLTDDLLEAMDLQAFVLGNHEFDWGISNIEEQKESSKFPFLGINIFDDHNQYASNIAEPSTIVEKGGVKVGIIGAIGPGQESSISSSALSGYSFSDDLSLVRDEADHLKEEEECDLVVLACHDSSEGYLSNLAYTINTDDIQGVFGGHSHSFDSELLPNSIPYVQGGSNARGYCKIKFDLKMKCAISYRYVSCYDKYHNIAESELNQDMVKLLQDAQSKFDGDVELCKFNGEFRRYEELNRFVPMALHDVAVDYGWEGTNPLIGLHNLSGIRANIPSGSVTKELLFKTSPFDNKVKVIPNVPGRNLSRLMGSIQDNHSSKFYAYYLEDDVQFNTNKTYDVVTIDFVSEGYYWDNSGLSDLSQYELDKEQSQPVYMFDCMIKFIDLYKQTYNTDIFNAIDFR